MAVRVIVSSPRNTCSDPTDYQLHQQSLPAHRNPHTAALRLQLESLPLRNETINSLSTWGNLTVPIYLAGADVTYTGLEELRSSRDEGVDREDECPLFNAHAGRGRAHSCPCVCEHLGKGLSLCQHGGAAPDD